MTFPSLRLRLGAAGLFAAAALMPARLRAGESPRPAPLDEPAKSIVEGGLAEARKATPYIMAYETMPYPGGDVPEGTGVCTDLVVRAFRNAGADLQKLLHEDRKTHPEAYPIRLWPHKKPDRNIDHRRCQNLVVWFRRFTRSLPAEPVPGEPETDYKPGDVVFFTRPGMDHPWHVALIGPERDRRGVPLVIDSFPPTTASDRPLDVYGPIGGRFRLEEPVWRRIRAGEAPVPVQRAAARAEGAKEKAR